MRKGLTEVVFILDRSGSMRGLEADTIGGFNSMIDKQKQEEGEAYISTVLFDDKAEVWNLTQEQRQTNRHQNMRVLGDFCYVSKGMVLNADEKTAKGEFAKKGVWAFYNSRAGRCGFYKIQTSDSEL